MRALSWLSGLVLGLPGLFVCFLSWPKLLYQSLILNFARINFVQERKQTKNPGFYLKEKLEVSPFNLFLSVIKAGGRILE